MWVICKEFKFEAAHQLPHHDGKCRNLHGHSWKGWVYVGGQSLIQEGAKQGMVMDYSDVKKYLEPIVTKYLDHHYLNDTTQLPNPTSETLAEWICNKLIESGLENIVAVRIDETCTSSCWYYPNSQRIPLHGDEVVVG